MLVRYTHVLEKFGEALYKAGSYVTEEQVHQRAYIVKHADAVTRETWCTAAFVVEVDEALQEFVCECGFYPHSGILCCHALKVFLFAIIITSLLSVILV